MNKRFLSLCLLVVVVAWASVSGQGPKTDAGGSLAGLPKLESEGVMVYWSEGKDTAWGLSKSLQKYTKIPLAPGAKDSAGPKLSRDIAVWQVGSVFFGFSGKIPQWDVLIVPEENKPELKIDGGTAQVTNSTERFEFTAASGRWQLVDETAKNSAAADKLPYSASLLLVKSNWSQSPAATEIGAELRRALEGEPVPEKDLAELPASGARILFPVSAGPTYSAQHYAELLSWLISRQLVLEIEPFGIAAKPFNSPTTETVAIPTLSKTYESFGLQPPKASSDLFFKQTTEFQWSVWEETVQRDLDQYERARGQSDSKPIAANSYDRLEVAYGPLDEGHVLIMHAFPGDSASDGNFRRAANTKGFQPLLVIQRKPAAPVAVVEPKLLLPDKVQRIKAESSHGHSFGMRGPISPTEPPTGSVTRSIISKGVMINWSEELDTVWGFSKALGKWAEQKLDPPAKERPTPLVNDDLFVWRVDSAYYAFSGVKGLWDVLRLPEGHTPPTLIDEGFFRVHDGDAVYTFAAATGRWSSPAGGAVESKNADGGGLPGAPGGEGNAGPASEGAGKHIVVFKLKNARAATIERILRSMFRVNPVADERTNSVIIQVDQETRDRIQSILVVLDEDTGSAPNPALPAAGNRRSSSSSSTGSSNSSGDAKELAGRYENLERDAAALAKQAQELQVGSGDKAKLEKLKSDLRKVVGQSFGARQELHRAEIGQLSRRIEGLREAVETRQKLGEQIIDQRVQDLLNPDLQWESSQDSTAAVTDAPAAGRSPGAASALAPAETGLTPAPFGSLGGASFNIIQSVLGVNVEFVTGSLVTGAGFRGGFLVTNSREEGSVHALRVGDIIVGVNGWLTLNDQSLAWAALQPVDKKMVFQFAKAREKAEMAPVHVVRDGKYETIQVELQPYSSAAQKSGPATSSMSTASPPAAANWPSSTWPPKGSGRNASQGFASGSSGQASPIVMNAGDRTVTLRSPDEFRRHLSTLQAGIASTKATPLSTYAGSNDAERAQTRQTIIDNTQRNLDFLREEYAAQLRLLELEVNDAASAVEAAASAEQSARRAQEKGVLAEGALTDTRRQTQSARLRLERARTLLELYQKADPKRAEAAQPALPATPAAEVKR